MQSRYAFRLEIGKFAKDLRTMLSTEVFRTRVMVNFRI